LKHSSTREGRKWCKLSKSPVADISHCTPMSALGHKQTCALQNVMSALPPEATSNATCKIALGQKRTSRDGYERSGSKATARQSHPDFGEKFVRRLHRLHPIRLRHPHRRDFRGFA